MEAALQRMRAAVAAIPAQPSPAKYLLLSAEAMGVPPPELTPEHLRAAQSALRERPSIGGTLLRVPGAAHPGFHDTRGCLET